MTISATTQGLRPGVCTSSNRPATPFEGQMIYETDTDLTYVYGGSAWQQVAGGTAVGNSGLVYITSATATAGQTSLSINDCFSSTYENYRIVTKFAAATSGYPALYARMRLSGTDNNSANYYYMMSGFTSAGGSANAGLAAQTEGYVGGFTGCSSFDVIGPVNASLQTLMQGQSTFYDGTTFYNRNFSVWHNVASSFTGITLYPSASTLTTAFTVRIYGYRQA